MKFINCQKNKLRILIVKQVNLFTGLIILLAVTSKKTKQKQKLGLLLVNVLIFFQEGKLKILELLKREQAKPVI